MCLSNPLYIHLDTFTSPSSGLNKKYVTSQLAAAAAASATAQEVLSGIRTVKSFAKEQQTINTYVVGLLEGAVLCSARMFTLFSYTGPT